MKIIMVTGAYGMLGSALRKNLEQKQEIYLLAPTRQELDLEDRDEVRVYLLKYRPEYIFHLAARVGGVLDNSLFPADYFTQNVKINTNVLESALELGQCNGDLTLLSVMSTCVYPDKATYPLTEVQMHNGPPHSSNYAYAYTKRMLDVQSTAYRQQYGVNFITVIPNNLYGFEDFYGHGCHVIPGMMLRFHEAKINNKSSVKVWSDGSPLREFTYAPDMAACLYRTAISYNYAYAKNNNEDGPINIGNTDEISISNLAKMMKEVTEFKGEIEFDLNMPAGQHRKPSSTARYEKLFGKMNFTKLEDGLKLTYEWFKKNSFKLRGIK